MPIYEYSCPHGHHQTMFLTLADHEERVPCEICGFGQWAYQIITAPMLIKVAQDVCYDSPIDGTPITSWAAREEDLKKNHCRPYDPEMKTDYTNRLKREDAALDQSIHATVEETVEKMPSAKRAKLASDLLDKGSDIEYARGDS